MKSFHLFLALSLFAIMTGCEEHDTNQVAIKQVKEEDQSLKSAAQKNENQRSPTATTDPSAGKPLTEYPKNKASFEVLDTQIIEEQYGIRYVTGTLLNKADKEAKFVAININLYDDAGNQVGSTLAAIQTLDANGKWKFKAPVTDKSATNFKVKDITSL